MALEKIISGGQNGADIGGILAAVDKGVPTGGMMPNGYRTLDGGKPEYAALYGMKEHSSWNYVPRTMENVRDSDGTMRIAQDHESSGEKCTLRGIKQYGKPYFDVWVRDTAVFTAPEPMHPKAAAKWIVDNKIKTLNVAGNSEKTAPGIGAWVRRYIAAVIDEVRKLAGGSEDVSGNGQT